MSITDGLHRELGKIIFCGCNDWKQVGRTKQIDENLTPNTYTPSLISTVKDVEFSFVACGASAAHCTAIDKDGHLWSWGRNENGQLAQGDKHTRNAPQIVKGIPEETRIVCVSNGKGHTVAIDSDGKMYASGNNKQGQLGLGSIKRSNQKGVEDERVEFVKSTAVPPTVKFVYVTCGSDFTVCLDEDGKLWSFGNPQYGQLGHGDDHEYNMKEGTVKLAYEAQPTPKMIQSGDLQGKKILKVSAGQNHVCCFDEDGKIYSWGNGGYGRLGHRVQKDEFMPKHVEIQGGDRNKIPADAILACGSTSTYISATGGQLYAFGKLKANGDNTMYPMPQMDLQGWILRDFAAGAVTFATCAQKSAVTWGAGGYGELGYGPNGKKSSACPDLVPDLEGKTTIMVAAGLGQTLFLVKSEDVKDMPVYEPLPETKDEQPKRNPAENLKGGAKKKTKTAKK